MRSVAQHYKVQFLLALQLVGDLHEYFGTLLFGKTTNERDQKLVGGQHTAGKQRLLIDGIRVEFVLHIDPMNNHINVFCLLAPLKQYVSNDLVRHHMMVDAGRVLAIAFHVPKFIE